MFNVGGILTLFNPDVGIPVKVQYRGKIGDQACVILNGLQMTVPVIWLSKRNKDNSNG